MHPRRKASTFFESREDEEEMAVESPPFLPTLRVPAAAAARDEMRQAADTAELRNIARHYDRSNGVGCNDDGNILHTAAMDNRNPNSSNGMTVLGVSLETKVKKMLKWVPGGTFKHNICAKCNRVNSNNYCTF